MVHEEEFWSLTKRDEVTGCLLWMGGQDRKGYGVFHRRPRKDILAHRRAWRFAIGDIPEGMCVCHRCDVPLCVNPDHLFLGTRAENSADRDAKGRQARGEANKGGGRLRTSDVLIIRERLSAGMTSVAIAHEFGISPGMVGHIKHGRAWRHV